MNFYKYNWYLQSLELPKILTGSGNQEQQQSFVDAKEKMLDIHRHHWFMPWNLKKAYDTPAGQLYTDVVFGLTLPAVTIGRKAKKTIEVIRATSEILSND
jgi:hypothetical protein